MPQFKLSFLAFCVGLLSAHCVQAQMPAQDDSSAAARGTLRTVLSSTEDFMSYSLEDLVEYRITTMARKEQSLEDAASAAYVITADEIRRSGALSIPEALRMVPGLNVAQISSERWAVSARGFNEVYAAKLLVLMDGVSIYSPTFAGVYWESQDLPMADIDRIEVIRGPGAALWGVNAMNGVINIITKSATAAAKQSVGGDFVQSDLGTNNLFGISARKAFSLESGGAVSLTAKAQQTGPSRLYRTNEISVPAFAGASANAGDGAEHLQAAIKLDKDFGKYKTNSKVVLNKSVSTTIGSAPSVPAFSNTPNGYAFSTPLLGEVTGARVQTLINWSESGAENKLQLFVDTNKSMTSGVWGSGTTQQGAGLAQAPSQLTFGGDKTEADLDFQQQRKIDQHDLIYGVGIRWIRDNLTLPVGPYRLEVGRNDRLNLSAFINDEISLAPNFKLILGSKFEKDGLTGYNTQPNIRGIYKFEDKSTLWGAVSESRRSPRRTESMATLDLLMRDASADLAAYGINVPPGLVTQAIQASPLSDSKPSAEKATSFELGWRGRLAEGVSMDAAAFYTDYSNLRGARLNSMSAPDLATAAACAQQYGPGRCYFTVMANNTNVETAKSYGLEASIDWRVTPTWRLQANYAYLAVKGGYADDLLSQIQTKAWEGGAPKNTLALRSYYNVGPKSNLDATLRYTGSTTHFTVDNPFSTITLPGRAVVDLRYSWKWAGADWAVAGKNLFAPKRAEFINSLPFLQPLAIQPSAHMSVRWNY